MKSTTTPFAAILDRRSPSRHLGVGSVLVVAAHAGILWVMMALGGSQAPRAIVREPEKLVVTLLDRPIEMPEVVRTEVVAAAPAASNVEAPKPKAPRVKPTAAAASVESKVQPAAAPPIPAVEPAPALPGPAPSEAPAPAAAAPSGSGTGSGTGIGVAGPKASGATVLPFSDGMTRPKLIDMVEPQFTREARDANVKGLFLAKCVITTQGTLQNCRILKGLPLMNEAVLSALARWRYTPVIYQGKPVAVDYVIQVRLAAP